MNIKNTISCMYIHAYSISGTTAVMNDAVGFHSNSYRHGAPRLIKYQEPTGIFIK